jgi:hypothetical protein
VFAACGWVITSQLFEETCCLHPNGYESIDGLKPLKMKAVRSSKTPVRSYLTKWHKIPEHLVPEYGNGFASNEIFQRYIVSSG